MADIPEEAVTAAATYLHDEECNDGDTQTCGRWRCGSDPENRYHSLHARHVEYYRARAASVLGAAWPGFVAAAEERTAGMAEALNNAAAIIEDRDRQLAEVRAAERERILTAAQNSAHSITQEVELLEMSALREILNGATDG